MGKGFALSSPNAVDRHRGLRRIAFFLFGEGGSHLFLCQSGCRRVKSRMWSRFWTQLWKLKEEIKKFPDMIPTKMLVYRVPDGGTQTRTVINPRRRKKSTGELFQKGYRVRMGHGQVADKEDQDGICYKLGACFHVISYWGKTCWTWEPSGGKSPKKLSAGTSRTLWTLCVSWSRFRFRIWSVLWSPAGKRSLQMKKKNKNNLARHGILQKDYLYIYI